MLVCGILDSPWGDALLDGAAWEVSHRPEEENQWHSDGEHNRQQVTPVVRSR